MSAGIARLSLYFLLFFVLPLPLVAAPKTVTVVASISILGDFVKQLGGEHVALKTLVGPDGDAHSYKPTPEDAKALVGADMLVENGLGLEGWMSRLAQASGFKGVRVIASEGVTPQEMKADADETGHAQGGKIIDPHAWQDVSNARIYAQNIAKALEKLLPEDAAAIAARAKAYDETLVKLDGWAKNEFAEIPAAQRKIITSHDAFGYFAAAYHIAFMAPQGLSTEGAPTAAGIAKLIDQMKREKVRTVFFENMSSPQLVTQLAGDAGASVGEAVYSDALSPASGPAADYVSMLRHNVALFKKAMQENGH